MRYHDKLASMMIMVVQLVLSVHVFGFNGGNGVSFEESKVLNLMRIQWKQTHDASSSCHLSQRSRTEKGATILEMKHRDYCSKTITEWNEKLPKTLLLDDLHVRSLHSRIKNILNPHNIKTTSDTTQIPLTSGVNLQTLNYIVTIQLGGRNMTVIVDTGSDLTWIQCQPCKSCYKQDQPFYDPSASTSHEIVSCDSPECESLLFATGYSGVCGEETNPPTCNYVVSYGDGSYTRGELGRERLDLGEVGKDRFLFGCGRSNKGLFGLASGLMGLGRSDISLTSQTSSMFNGVFSYCLPSTFRDDTSSSPSSGSLVFGGNYSVYKNSSSVSYTRMIPNPNLPTFYFLNITGITVGGVELPTLLFAKTRFIIDSGTVITRLPPSIYNAFKTEFSKQFSGYPTVPGYALLDTCYNLTGYQQVNIPTIKMLLEGSDDDDAQLNVDVMGIFYFVKTDASRVCLAFASLGNDNDISIIGNYQQRNQRVVYDTKESRIGFASETCSFE